jgi:glycosyltransferase involved in cell wall biosynthesis
MTKVLFVAYYFPPAGGAGVQRSEKFVKYLPSEGFLPIVIAGPTLPESRWTPHDLTLMKSIPAEVPVHRVDGPAPIQCGRWRSRSERWLRTPNLFSKWWIEAATELGLRVADGEKLIFATMSPFESGEVARRLSQHLGIPWVADLRDPWALDEMQVYPTGIHRKLEMRKMERILSTAATIIMNTPEAAAALRREIPGLRKKNIISITNGFDREDFSDALPARDDGKFRIVHAGYLHTNNGLDLRNRRFASLLRGTYDGVDILTRSHTMLLEAVERWCLERRHVRNDLELVFAGKTSAEDRAVVEASGIGSLIQFTGYLSHRESVRLVRTADLLFLPMHNLPAGWRCRIVPGKTYEYMASSRPILAAVPDGDTREFLEKCGTALVCRPDHVEGMMRRLEQVYSAWKGNRTTFHSNESFVNQFERRTLTHALAKCFSSVNAATEAHAINIEIPATANKQVISIRGSNS